MIQKVFCSFPIVKEHQSGSDEEIAGGKWVFLCVRALSVCQFSPYNSSVDLEITWKSLGILPSPNGKPFLCTLISSSCSNSTLQTMLYTPVRCIFVSRSKRPEIDRSLDLVVFERFQGFWKSIVVVVDICHFGPMFFLCSNITAFKIMAPT